MLGYTNHWLRGAELEDAVAVVVVVVVPAVVVVVVVVVAGAAAAAAAASPAAGGGEGQDGVVPAAAVRLDLDSLNVCVGST